MGRLYRIDFTDGCYRVMRRGFLYPPFTNEGIRSAMAAEGPGFKWYLLAETHTLPHAFAAASMIAGGGGGFLPLGGRSWRAA